MAASFIGKAAGTPSISIQGLVRSRPCRAASQRDQRASCSQDLSRPRSPRSGRITDSLLTCGHRRRRSKEYQRPASGGTTSETTRQRLVWCSRCYAARSGQAVRMFSSTSRRAGPADRARFRRNRRHSNPRHSASAASCNSGTRGRRRTHPSALSRQTNGHTLDS
jgi:hypothetical protein